MSARDHLDFRARSVRGRVHGLVEPDVSALDYFHFRDHLARDLVRGLVAPNLPAIFERARLCSGLNPAAAAEFTERFVASLKGGLERAGRGR